LLFIFSIKWDFWKPFWQHLAAALPAAQNFFRNFLDNKKPAYYLGLNMYR